MEHKSIPFEVKADVDDMRIKGYASVFDNWDSHGDKIIQGAFAETLKERFERPETSQIKVLYQHAHPMGMPEVMEEDSTGLYVEGAVTDTAKNRDRMALIADGVVDGMSIGFETVRFESVDDSENPDRSRILKELKLFEWSPVTWGANEAAYTELASKAEQLQQVYHGLKEGRTLSKANAERLEQAASAIEAVLEEHRSDGTDKQSDDDDSEMKRWLEGDFLDELDALNKLIGV